MVLVRSSSWEKVVSGTMLLVAVLPLVVAHGRLKDPPGRSTLWRSPDLCHDNAEAKNYQDMQLNCGGRFTHWDTNKGECGVCGDNAVGPQDNQPGGRYFMPIISRCYKAKETGQLAIHANIEITSNHMGYMEFKLCKQDNMQTAVTQECLDQNLLKVKKKGLPNTRIKRRLWIQQAWTSLDVVLYIPAGMVCNDCVLQWTYYTGNNGASCKISKKTGKFNCGSGLKGVETFVNCADIAILNDCAKLGRPVGGNKQCYKPTLSSTGAILPYDGNSSSVISVTAAPEVAPTTVNPCSKNNVKCVAETWWNKIPGMTKWCWDNMYTDVDSCRILVDADRTGYHSKICDCKFMKSR